MRENYKRAAHLLGMDVEVLWDMFGGEEGAVANWSVLEKVVSKAYRGEYTAPTKHDRRAISDRQLAHAQQMLRKAKENRGD